MDRSKYRNKDAPVGYITPIAEFIYKYGEVIDGEHYVLAPYIWKARIHERPDYAKLSDLELSDDESITDDAAMHSTAEERSTISPVNVEKEKEIVIIKEELVEDSVPKKINISKPRKKGHDSTDTSDLEAYVSHMNISSKKHKKKKKTRKSKKEYKDDYSSDSSGQSSSYKYKLVKYSPSPSPSPERSFKRSSERSCKRSPERSCKRSPERSSKRSPERSSKRSPERSSKRSPERSSKRSPERASKRSLERSFNSQRSPPERSFKRSPERSPDRYNDRYLGMKIKKEPLDQPQHLFGSYHCDICNITMNSLLTYNTHVNGKRHRKNLKAKNVPEVVAQSIPATVVSEDQTKYPKPRSGVIRRKVNSPASIQHIIEIEVKTPCPGLSFVTEIHGIDCVQYYCSMCDSVCSSNSIIPHLTGFKHQLRSVKEFKPGAYDYMSYEPKYRIEKELLSILRAVQKKDGMGRMTVEVDELVSDSCGMPLGGPCTSSDYYSQPSTSRDMGKGHSSMSFPELYDQATIPDMSASDFFCHVCDSHMNSMQMWEAHVRGKRHLINLKKMPGDRPSKNKTVLVPNKKAHLLKRLEDECPDEPAVGLKEIRETIISETNSHSYQCFLCGSCHTSLDILDHVIGLKHRTKYLDHIDYSGKEVISGMSELNAISLVRDMCVQVERSEGRDNPPVYMSKDAVYR